MLKHLLSCLILAAASLGAAAADHSAVREALRDSILSSISGAEISGNRVKITDFGAKGDGMKDCRKAFEKAINMYHTSLFFNCLTISISGVKK